MKKPDLQKEWLKLQKMHRDLVWMIYGKSGEEADNLKHAASLIKVVMDSLKKEIEE